MWQEIIIMNRHVSHYHRSYFLIAFATPSNVSYIPHQNVDHSEIIRELGKLVGIVVTLVWVDLVLIFIAVFYTYQLNVINVIESKSCTCANKVKNTCNVPSPVRGSDLPNLQEVHFRQVFTMPISNQRQQSSKVSSILMVIDLQNSLNPLPKPLLNINATV